MSLGPESLRLDGKEVVLLASCFDDEGDLGGLFSFDGTSVQQLDRYSSTGLATDGQTLARAFRDPEVGPFVSEILTYHRAGPPTRTYVSESADIHEMVFDSPWLAAASTYQNSILWIEPGGEVVRTWRAPGEVDSWHINGLFVWEENLYVSAFGRFGEFRQWKEERGRGIIFCVATGADVATGLHEPHSPRYADHRWLVCNSGKSELFSLEPHTNVRCNCAQVGGFSRGLALSDDLILVGISNSRDEPSGQTNSGIVVLDRHEWTRRATIPLPVSEVFDLILVPRPLYEAVKTCSARADAAHLPVWRGDGINTNLSEAENIQQWIGNLKGQRHTIKIRDESIERLTAQLETLGSESPRVNDVTPVPLPAEGDMKASQMGKPRLTRDEQASRSTAARTKTYMKSLAKGLLSRYDFGRRLMSVLRSAESDRQFTDLQAEVAELRREIQGLSASIETISRGLSLPGPGATGSWSGIKEH